MKKDQDTAAASPQVEDAAAAGVHGFLTQYVDDIGPTLQLNLITGGRSNPTYTVTDGHHQWVLRRPPHGLVLQSAHDMRREFRVMAALAPTAVPVPQPIAYCEDESILGA